MLQGHKTRIDRTVAGLLQHQMTIAQKIVSTIGQQHSTSRVPKTVPKFLRAVASRLSADIFEKLKKEWERYINLMTGAVCKRLEGTVSSWKVVWKTEAFVCDDIEWTCTCLFYRSHHLPCRHIMHLAESKHHVKVRPTITIHDRWSTLKALNVKGELAAAASLLKPIVQMSKLKSPKIKLLNDEHAKARPGGVGLRGVQPDRPKEIVYVRLHRKERANQLAAWKDTVEIGLNSSNCRGGKSELKSSNEDDPDDDAEGDALSAFDPSDARETVSLMNKIEDLLPNSDGCTDSGNASGSEDDIPPTQQTTLHDTASVSSSLQIIEKSIADGKGSKDGNDLKSETSTTTVRAVDIVNLRRQNAEETQRVAAKQLRQITLNAVPNRLAVHKYPTNLTVRLDKLLRWARNTANMKFVIEMLENQYAGALTGFYAIKTLCTAGVKDRKMVGTRLEKDRLKCRPFCFGDKHGLYCCRCSSSTKPDAGERGDCQVYFKRLRTEFVTLSNKAMVSFDNIVGGICRGWVNDGAIDFCLESIAASVGQCLMLSTRMGAIRWPKTPEAKTTETRFIVHPVNLSESHRGIIIVNLTYVHITNTLRIHVYMYEPLVDESYRAGIEEVWEGTEGDEEKDKKEGLIKFVQRWHKASEPNGQLVFDATEWGEAPQQPDYASCEVLIVAQAYDTLTGSQQLQYQKVSKKDVLVMRLRMLWIMLCHS
ncbi:unnamed protein product [Phytophthora lilii]|uniref:Unnamed protein product n=1 Tax=Phytophthora lilii TaxID=2077276 RepID=A0A9W6TS73_9STRA|nr:unnamed protein product [Phytophthora lilii]